MLRRHWHKEGDEEEEKGGEDGAIRYERHDEDFPINVNLPNAVN